MGRINGAKIEEFYVEGGEDSLKRMGEGGSLKNGPSVVVICGIRAIYREKGKFNENSFFNVNARTTKIAPHDIFTLNIMHYSE